MIEKEKLFELFKLANKQRTITARLEEPARAAYNAMMDAGMKRTADPLGAVLFELDSVKAEIQTIVSTDPDGLVKVMLGLLERKE